MNSIDLFTKWIETKIVYSKKGSEIANVLENIIIKKHGTPCIIYSDNGFEFKAKEVQNLANMYKISWRFCCPNYHRSIGAIERSNKSLLDKLRCLNEFNDENWEKKIKNATYALDISFNRSIDSSPFILKFGMEPIFPINFKLKIYKRKIPIQKSVENRNSKFPIYVKKNITNSKIKTRNNYYVGEYVLIYHSIITEKLSSG